MEELKFYIDDVANFPEEGVNFKDISRLLRERFKASIDAFEMLFAPEDLSSIDAFAGIDARGFIFAAALAERLGKAMLMIRKHGKLPPPIVKKEYSLEYANNVIEMQPGSGKLIIIDDVLATGGTLAAAANLCVAAGYEVVDIATLINLKFLNDFAWNNLKAKSVIDYEC